MRANLGMIIQFASKRLNISVSIDWLAIYIAIMFSGLLIIPAQAQSKIYDPPSISSEAEVSDILTENDIPTGEGGFARDYFVELEKGDQVAIDLTF